MNARRSGLSTIVITLQQLVSGLAQDRGALGSAVTEPRRADDERGRPAARRPAGTAALDRLARRSCRRISPTTGRPSSVRCVPCRASSTASAARVVRLVGQQLSVLDHRDESRSRPATTAASACNRSKRGASADGISLVQRTQPGRHRSGRVRSRRRGRARGVLLEAAAVRQQLDRLPRRLHRGGRAAQRRRRPGRRRQGRQGRRTSRSRARHVGSTSTSTARGSATQSTAAIKIKTLLGQKYLAIDPLGDRALDPDTGDPARRARPRRTTSRPRSRAWARTVGQIDTDAAGTSFDTHRRRRSEHAGRACARASTGCRRCRRRSPRATTRSQLLVPNTRRITAGPRATATRRSQELVRDGNLLLPSCRDAAPRSPRCCAGPSSSARSCPGWSHDNDAELGPALAQLTRVTDMLHAQPGQPRQRAAADRAVLQPAQRRRRQRRVARRLPVRAVRRQGRPGAELDAPAQLRPQAGASDDHATVQAPRTSKVRGVAVVGALPRGRVRSGGAFWWYVAARRPDAVQRAVHRVGRRLPRLGRPDARRRGRHRRRRHPEGTVRGRHAPRPRRHRSRPTPGRRSSRPAWSATATSS